MQCARLGRRDRKGCVFLASSDVEVSSLLPCLLDVHRSFTFGRHPSSVSVTLHRHFVVSRRSFLSHAQVESLSGWVTTYERLCSSVVARTSLLRKNEKGQRIHLSQLVSAFSHAVPPSILDPKTRPDDVLASGSAWVSDLSLCDGTLEFAGALSSGSGCESRLPRRTSMTSPSTTIGSSSSGSPSSVMSAKCRVRPSRTASVRSGSSDVTVSIPSASSLVAGLTCTYATSSACAPIPSRFVQASVLHSGRIRQVHTILGLHPSVCV